jgi:hypothetical protein
MDLKNTKSISFLLLLLISLSYSCKRSNNVEEVSGSESKPETVVKRRDDGTISSVNQVNENSRVHGVRATYYEDGKRDGLTRIYYQDGSLSAEFIAENGNILPGLKEYMEDGTLVTSYPEVQLSAKRIKLNLLSYRRKVWVYFNKMALL